jgi:Methyltransferase domain
MFASATIRGKYQINYLSCSACDFIQTEDPFWLKEAYAEPINRSDVGYVSRNLLFSKVTKAIIVLFFNRKARFVDYGGGWGLFVRLMRDLGYDFWRSDKYCPNLFAPDYEVAEGNIEPFELLTAFEVFEHLPDPMDEIQAMLKQSNNIFFSTLLQPSVRPSPTDWWYYGLEHGQHVSFYTKASLQAMARKLNLHLSTDGVLFHLLSKKRVSPPAFSLATRKQVAALLHWVVRPRSLQLADAFRAIETARITGKK